MKHAMTMGAVFLTILAGTIVDVRPAENALTPDEKTAGWELLFDGHSFAGWRNFGQPGIIDAGWRIEGGTLITTAPAIRNPGLVTEREFSDFELSWEWKVAPGANNGVKYFVTEQRPQAPGHEYQMIDDARHADAKFGPQRQTAAFYDVIPSAADKPLRSAGEWNWSRLIVHGDAVEHWLNGRKVTTYTLGSPELRTALARSKFKDWPDFGAKIPGQILLTHHGAGCWFRNIKVRALPPPASSAGAFPAVNLPVGKKLAKKFGLPPLDAARQNLWSIFGMVTRFADELGVPKEELTHWLESNHWDLPHAPALGWQYWDPVERPIIDACAGDLHRFSGFARREGGAVGYDDTAATISCDRDFIRVSFTSMRVGVRDRATQAPREDLLSEKERWYWNGDFVRGF